MSSIVKSSHKDEMLEMFRFYSMDEGLSNAWIESDTTAVKIKEWSIRVNACNRGKIFPNFSLHIRGLKLNQNGVYTPWGSSEIVEVKAKKYLMTKRSVYYLSGPIDVAQSIAEGFEGSFNEYFKDGFPKEWQSIIDVFGDYIIKKGASTKEINQQITSKIFNKNMPRRKSIKCRNFDQETRFHRSAEKDFASRNGPQRKQRKRISDPKKDENSAKREPLGTIFSNFKALNDTWTVEDMKELWSAFHSINPCSEDDWNKVMNLFGQNRKIEEVKEQAKLMNLNTQNKKVLSPGSELIKKFKRLLPNGQLPRKGTLRREVLQDEILTMLYCKKDEQEKSFVQIDDDSDDEIICEAVNDSKNSLTFNDLELIPTTPIQYSLLVRQGRRRSSSESSIEDIGDDFGSVKRRTQYKYPLKYRAENQNRKLNHNRQEIEDESKELFEDDD